jgi:hypothetical protein
MLDVCSLARQLDGPDLRFWISADSPDARHETTEQKADDANEGPAEHPGACHTRAIRQGAPRDDYGHSRASQHLRPGPTFAQVSL